MSSADDKLSYACRHEVRSFKVNFLLTESEVFKEKSATEAEHFRTEAKKKTFIIQQVFPLARYWSKSARDRICAS